jgi:hypothetical protein
MKKLKLLILFYLFSLTNAWSQENFEDKVDAMILRGTIYLNQYDYPYLESLLKADLEDANEDQEVIKEEQEKDLTYYLKNEKNAPNGTLKLSVSAIKYAYGSILAGAFVGGLTGHFGKNGFPNSVGTSATLSILGSSFYIKWANDSAENSEKKVEELLDEQFREIKQAAKYLSLYYGTALDLTPHQIVRLENNFYIAISNYAVQTAYNFELEEISISNLLKKSDVSEEKIIEYEETLENLQQLIPGELSVDYVMNNSLEDKLAALAWIKYRTEQIDYISEELLETIKEFQGEVDALLLLTETSKD